MSAGYVQTSDFSLPKARKELVRGLRGCNVIASHLAAVVLHNVDTIFD